MQPFDVSVFRLNLSTEYMHALWLAIILHCRDQIAELQFLCVEFFSLYVLRIGFNDFKHIDNTPNIYLDITEEYSTSQPLHHPLQFRQTCSVICH